MFNASDQDLEFAVPTARYGQAWEKTPDKAPEEPGDAAAVKPGDPLTVRSRSIQLLHRPDPRMP